jgi:hypothetical protein
MKARLHWDDGRVEEVDRLREDVEVIVRQGRDGRTEFVATGDIDADGFAVFTVHHANDRRGETVMPSLPRKTPKCGECGADTRAATTHDEELHEQMPVWRCIRCGHEVPR